MRRTFISEERTTLGTPVALLTVADLGTLDYQPGRSSQTATVWDLHSYCNPPIPLMRKLSSQRLKNSLEKSSFSVLTQAAHRLKWPWYEIISMGLDKGEIQITCTTTKMEINSIFWGTGVETQVPRVNYIYFFHSSGLPKLRFMM